MNDKEVMKYPLSRTAKCKKCDARAIEGNFLCRKHFLQNQNKGFWTGIFKKEKDTRNEREILLDILSSVKNIGWGIWFLILILFFRGILVQNP